MTIAPPTVGPIDTTQITSAFRTNADVAPFVYREAETFTSMLERLARWTVFNLIPYLNTNFEDIQESWVDNVTDFVAIINQGLNDQTATINQALTDQQAQVAANLAETLNQITSGESAALNDSVINTALRSANSQALAFLDGRFLTPTGASNTYYSKTQADDRFAPKPTAFGFYLLKSDQINPSGSSESTAGVNAFFAGLVDGAHVVVPSNVLITLAGTVTINKRVRLSGDGELRWTAGIANAPMIQVNADGCTFENLYLTNPNRLAAASGTRTTGITISANSVRVSKCRIDGQQQAICVTADGEWHDFQFTDNIISNVPGNGGGASDTTTSVGEDRGDGITVWGATAIITGNRVWAASGTDARIGIHVEGIPNFEQAPYAYGDSSCTITGNIVSGRFRRGITSETVAAVTITGNVVWDSTWWGLSIIGGAHSSVVANNVVNWTRTSADNQGGAWTPNRCGIMVYGQNSDSIVSDNTIRVMPGAVMPNGIVMQAANTGAPAANTTIKGNRISDAANGIGNGINIMNSSLDTRLLDNDISGILATGNGINAFKADKLTIRGNKIKGQSATQGKGIYVSSTGTSVRCDFNTVDSFGVGISLFARSVFTTAIGNVIANATTGFDFFQTVVPVTQNDNTFVAVTTKTANLPTGAIASGNN